MPATVTQHITSAFVLANELAQEKNPELLQSWLLIAVTYGSHLRQSTLPLSIFFIGELDVLLRNMEQNCPPLEIPSDIEKHYPALYYQSMLSNRWVCDLYEVSRVFINRGIIKDDENFNDLAKHLEAIRIPLEKHEIAKDRKLATSLELEKILKNPSTTQTFYKYNKDDILKAFGPRMGYTKRGSVSWNVVDQQSRKLYWIDRLSLSERFISLLVPNPLTPPHNIA